jgi:hypothetical protein
MTEGKKVAQVLQPVEFPHQQVWLKSTWMRLTSKSANRGVRLQHWRGHQTTERVDTLGALVGVLQYTPAVHKKNVIFAF